MSIGSINLQWLFYHAVGIGKSSSSSSSEQLREIDERIRSTSAVIRRDNTQRFVERVRMRGVDAHNGGRDAQPKQDFSWFTKSWPYVLLIFCVPLIIIIVVFRVVYVVLLHLIIWLVWCTRGINVVLVTSDSPTWHDYIDTNILPKLPATTIVLNWSQRRHWSGFSLKVLGLVGGDREFNPMVIVFRPFRWTKTFRFYKAFLDHKHGKPRSLDVMQTALFQFLERVGITSGI